MSENVPTPEQHHRSLNDDKIQMQAKSEHTETPQLPDTLHENTCLQRPFCKCLNPASQEQAKFVRGISEVLPEGGLYFAPNNLIAAIRDFFATFRIFYKNISCLH